MGDEGAVLPQVQLVAGRLELETQGRARSEIQGELMRGAGRGAGDRTGEAAVDHPVQMAAQDALDLRMARDHFGEGGGIVERALVHARCRSGTAVMHHQRVGRFGAAASWHQQPGEPIGAQHAAASPGMRVERDEPQRSNPR